MDHIRFQNGSVKECSLLVWKAVGSNPSHTEVLSVAVFPVQKVSIKLKNLKYKACTVSHFLVLSLCSNMRVACPGAIYWQLGTQTEYAELFHIINSKLGEIFYF